MACKSFVFYNVQTLNGMSSATCKHMKCIMVGHITQLAKNFLMVFNEPTK